MDNQFEFDESELWNSNEVIIPETKHQKPSSLPSKKPAARRSTTASSAVNRRSNTATSLPVNVPDWSNILPSKYYTDRRRGNVDVDDRNDCDDGDDWLPPHEFLARTRVQPFSVHEGAGRTLKGRDLSTVRDAIWKQTGFED